MYILSYSQTNSLTEYYISQEYGSRGQLLKVTT